MFTRIVNRRNGKQYVYAEERWREGGKVRSRSRSLGPVGGTNLRKPGFLRSQFDQTHGIDWEKIEQELIVKMDAEEAQAEEFAARMHADYGMRLDAVTGPTEKASNPVLPGASDRPQPPDAPAPEAAPETPPETPDSDQT